MHLMGLVDVRAEAEGSERILKVFCCLEPLHINEQNQTKWKHCGFDAFTELNLKARWQSQISVVRVTEHCSHGVLGERGHK